MNALLKAFILWLVILVLAVLNGAAREQALIPALGRFAGMIVSGGILLLCIFLVAMAAAPWYGRLPSGQWWLIGVLWVALTLIFEFGFGHLVQHLTWPQMLEAYTFKDGNIWPLVLVAALVAPWLAARLRGGIRE